MSCHAKSSNISIVILSKRVISCFATFRQTTDSCQDVSLTEASCWVWLAPRGSSMTLEWHPASRIQMKVQHAHPWCEIPYVMQLMSEAIGPF